MGELLNRYGAEAMYLTVHFAADQDSMFWSGNLYSLLIEYNADGVETWPKEIVRYLMTCTRPWCAKKIITAYYGSRGQDRGDIVDRREYIAALLLLALPLIEFWADTSFTGVLDVPRMLRRIVDPVTAARRGTMPVKNMRGVLVSHMPAEVADFVVRWASREFNLLAQE